MVDLGTDRFIRQVGADKTKNYQNVWLHKLNISNIKSQLNIRTCSVLFITASLLPRKLQAALEQALEQRNDIINQDSDSESDDEYNSLNSLVSEAFIRFFLETIGHYSLFITQNERGERVFQREPFRKSVASKSIRRFLGVFMESQMFAGFIQDRELRKTRAKGRRGSFEG
uniref:UDENN domain-containing protein n=1 Tax=Oryzias sinensis TaxID=183150 RepID=A0A8C8DHV8_9TELE